MVLVALYFVLQQACALDFMKHDFIVVQTGDMLEFCAVSGILQLSQVLFVCCKRKCGRHGKLNSKYVYSIYPMREALQDRLLWLVALYTKESGKCFSALQRERKDFLVPKIDGNKR
jgi:hypothetical protein